jgi:hypothetical protein
LLDAVVLSFRCSPLTFVIDKAVNGLQILGIHTMEWTKAVARPQVEASVRRVHLVAVFDAVDHVRDGR